MIRVASMTGLKLASRSIFRKQNWSSADQMAEEVSQHAEYYAGTCNVGIHVCMYSILQSKRSG